MRDVLERASARESAARVAAGAICKLLLRECGIEVKSGVLSVGSAVDEDSPRSFASLERVREDSPLRAIDPRVEARMVAAVDAAKKAGETLGGTILVGARGVPAGLGSYVSWDRKLDGRIGAALRIGPSRQGSRARLDHRRLARSRARSPRRDRERSGRDPAPSDQSRGARGNVTSSGNVIAVAFMKPLSTLAKGSTGGPRDGRSGPSAYERTTSRLFPPAASSGGMLAFVLADGILGLTGGDRLEDVTTASPGTAARLATRAGTSLRFVRICAFAPARGSMASTASLITESLRSLA